MREDDGGYARVSSTNCARRTFGKNELRSSGNRPTVLQSGGVGMMMPQRTIIDSIVAGALAAVDPLRAVRRHLAFDGARILVDRPDGGRRAYRMDDFERVLVVGCGKAAAPMAAAVEEILGGRIDEGVVVVKYGHGVDLARVGLVEAGHPVPDENAVHGARTALDLLAAAGSRDLVIALISGGGSALLTLPAEGISLADKRKTTELLLASGAAIGEMNAVRKRLSLVKGGLLARAAYPATVIALAVSDVVGDDIGVIASGPFAPDESTFADALAVMHAYALGDAAPRTVIERLERGARGDIAETPRLGDPVFDRVMHRIVASNALALEAARVAACACGYFAYVVPTPVIGDTADAARAHAAIARGIVERGAPVRRPACVISGGETTVAVRGGGRGGRNTEFAMHAAIAIDGMDGVCVASVGTDGTDGPTNAAGACADGSTVARARALGMDSAAYAANNDSYSFFERLGDLIVTGPTRTNVMDVHIVIVD